MLTQSRLKELLHYDSTTGKFRWLVDRRNRNGGGGVRAGDVAGTLRRSGNGGAPYLWIGIDRKYYPAHRLAIFYVTGKWVEVLVDHKDRNTLNNAYSNLRPATKIQNAHNSSGHADSISGRKGVGWDKNRNKWQAIIRANGRNIFLGRYASLQEASTAYRLAAKKYQGDFMPGAGG